MEEVNSSIISSIIHGLPLLPNLHYQQFMTVSWYRANRHCHNAALPVAHSLSRTLAAIILVMDSSEGIAYQLPYFQSQKL